MLIIGLTGSIGMGKSTAAARLRELGLPVFDSDAEVHRLYAAEAVPLIEAAFPGTTANGAVDRQRLSTAIIAEPDGFKQIERIIHPLVRQGQKRFLARARAEGAALAVLEVPLLFETGVDSLVDVTVVVSAPAEIQRARVLARPGMTAGKLDIILGRQMPDAEKRTRADFVVDTGVTLDETRAQIDSIVARLSGRTGEAYDRHWH
jgi:dephospho-CoA kinase